MGSQTLNTSNSRRVIFKARSTERLKNGSTMFISYVLCVLMFHSILALDGDEVGDDDEYDDDYYDYEGDIEDFDYDKLKEIENSLNSINLDPKPVPTLSPEEMDEYE